MITILFFGRLSEAANTGRRTIPLPPGVADTAALRGWLGRDEPALAAALAEPAMGIAVNGALSRTNVILTGNEEVAFMAPVSGG